MSTTSFKHSLVWASLALGLAHCALHVERPELTPQHVDFLSVDSTAITLRVTVIGYNPNAFELPLKDLSARLTLGDFATGSTLYNLSTVLAPKQPTTFSVDLRIPWDTAPDQALLLAQNPELPYSIDGTVRVQHYLSVRAHFVHRGTLSRDQLLGRALEHLENFLEQHRHRHAPSP